MRPHRRSHPAPLRRPARWLAWAVPVCLLGAGCGLGAAPSQQACIVLGFDGMDYGLTKQLMDAGRMPNFVRLAKMGSFGPLQTSVPPQSPVAWSNFITGMDAGGHGIFDFIHRDPQTMLPYLSTSRTEAGRSVHFGKWQIPLSSGKVVLLRHGAAFWEKLKPLGVETTIMRVPANFPPDGTATRELSGMGTPDILGGYGTFTFYTSDASEPENEVGGGRVLAGQPTDGVFHGIVRGPANPFRRDPKQVTTDFTLYIDPERPLAKLVMGGEERILQQGEWSDWVPVEFPLAPLRTLRGMCRFYPRQLRPGFELYVSPVNLDPMHPAMPISAPDSWAADVARATGRFYTQGIPEDTKAYSAGVFEPREFLAQARLALDENVRQYRWVLEHFDRGLLFHYFGTTDQISHMMWRPMDPGHPAYDVALDAPYAQVIPDLYQEMDGIVGYTLEHMDSTAVLVVMSDHGFTSWRRSFHLNAWLREQGYLVPRSAVPEDDAGALTNVDWQRTRAYGLGLTGLYLNLRGRERWGIVPPEERDALLAEIAAKLEATLDPASGAPAVSHAYRSDQAYADRGYADIGPDIIVGYAKGTRCSDDSAVGMIGSEVFADNLDAWSGDHCMDPGAVPGILLVNRRLHRPVTALQDLGAAILAEFSSPAAAAAAGGVPSAGSSH